jgi:hypothetical protein
MILLLNLIELLIISFFLAINLAFFNSTFFTRAKFLSARIKVLLVYRPIILKKTEIKNIKQESYVDYFILSFSR